MFKLNRNIRGAYFVPARLKIIEANMKCNILSNSDKNTTKNASISLLT